jgi:hypothetical protein
MVRPRLIRNTLSGAYVGHPLQPMLTDLPIDAWAMFGLLDTLGGRGAERSADMLVAAGALAAAPTAASGLNDWSDIVGADTRIGLVHAALNSTALGLYVTSPVARAHRHRSRGKVLGLTGLGLVLLAAIWADTSAS